VAKPPPRGGRNSTVRSPAVLLCVALVSGPPPLPAQSDPFDSLAVAARANASPLEGAGRDFLLGNAARVRFFMLGELHGDNEVPALVQSLWPAMWASGYRHTAAEVSPWAADRLAQEARQHGSGVFGLWTVQQAAVILTPARSATNNIWGSDIEEIQPQALIRELQRLNPGNEDLERMAALTATGYRRSQAPQLRALLAAAAPSSDTAPDGISLRENLAATLRVESERLDGAHRLTAQQDREDVMKQQLLKHYEADTVGKVFLRFGQSHLFRGYDPARGVSTLGNFVAEFAIAQGTTAFNVAVFGAGGEIRLNGVTQSADQTGDEPGLAWLARLAPWPATVFDVRPLRVILHAIPPAQRTPDQQNLLEWVDGYDALICYKLVTPLDTMH
jgi:hypothetical protein